MGYINSSCKVFIGYIKEIYQNLSESEKQNIAYKKLIELAAKKYYGGECYTSQITYGYKLCKDYYLAHPLNEKNPYIKDDTKTLTIEEFKSILDYDIRKERLMNIIDEQYRYYWFDKNVIYEDGSKQIKRFVILECPPDITNNAYNVISNYFDDLFESVYPGFGGIVLIFDITSTTRSFNEFIAYIKKENIM